jgi:hypothetical protein
VETGGGDRAWGWFFAWLLVGGGYLVALLGALTIGILVLPVVGILTVVLARRPGAVAGVAGIVSGLGLPLLYVAWLNRDGPGTVCTATGAGTDCTDEWSPWPWLVVGLVVLAAGVLLFRARRPAAGRP